MIMDERTLIKLIGCIVSFMFLFFGMFFLLCWITNSLYGYILSFMLSVLIVSIIFLTYIPIWFKDYIDKFWENEERKKCQEGEVEK